MTRTLIATTLASALLAGTALAQDYTLRFNHVLGPSEPYHEGFTAWAEAVEPRRAPVGVVEPRRAAAPRAAGWWSARWRRTGSPSIMSAPARRD